MTAEKVERRLAAIVSMDVEGYSRLMGVDEVGTLEILNDYREAISGLVTGHDGRIFGTAGDSVLAEFASAINAVQCASEIQNELRWRNKALSAERQLRFRVGINVGDVILEGGDKIRCEVECAFERFPCRRSIAGVEPDGAERIVGFGEVSLEAEGTVERHGRLAVPSQLMQRAAEVGEDFGNGIGKCGGALVGDDRTFGVARLQPRIAQMKLRFGVAGFGPHRGPEMAQGRSGIASGQCQLPEALVRVAIVRVAFQGGAQTGPGICGGGAGLAALGSGHDGGIIQGPGAQGPIWPGPAAAA